MNSEKNPNANASGTTPPTAPARPDPKAESEADHLTRQQAEARAAITAVLTDMKQALAQGVSVREWTLKYPWIMAGGAIVAGFAAGVLATPPKDESLREFWQSIKDKLAPDPDAQPAAVPPVEVAPKPSLFSTLLQNAVKIAGPALATMASEMMARREAPNPDDPHMGNGNAHSREPAGYPEGQ